MARTYDLAGPENPVGIRLAGHRHTLIWRARKQCMKSM